jgi:predicted O-linked N-acetylglucosamine transferase (SPINDLY family)
MSSSSNLSDILNAYQQNPQAVLNGNYSPNGITPITPGIASSLLSSYNDMITAQTNAAICDASCQYDASLNALYKAMEKAKINETKAPYEYEQAEEAYYAFLGQSMPNNFQEQQYIEKYNVLMEQYKTQFDELFNHNNQMNDNYNTMYINTNNSYELYLDVLKKNEKLRKQFNITASNIFTNDRKSMYENQGLKTVQFHGTILFIFHILFIIFFIFAIFYFKTTLSIYWKIGLIILIILQPIIARLIMFILNKLYNNVKQLLPKNVYLTL